MIDLLQDLPDHVVGFVASGQVGAADYEKIVIPAVEAALAKHDRVRILYQLASDFSGFTPGAMWDDMKLGLGHLTAWERVAVVTDVGWVAHATSMLGFVMPCPVRVFPLDRMADARAWICA